MNPRTRASDLFTRDEIRRLTARSDAAGWWAIGSTWAVIALTLTALALLPNPVTFILAVIILGGQQLALAILMHEAAHRTLFARPVLNDVVTDWLCARVMWNDVARYRQHHLQHHAHTSTEKDPDLSLINPFPTSRSSLARKFIRDLTGISGLRRMLGQLLMDFGVLKYTVAAHVERRPRDGRTPLDYVSEGMRNMSGFVLTNLALAGALAAVGQFWLYSAWVVAYLTTFSLYLRIRALAEHACTERSADFLRNTRTTRAGLLARVTVAPLCVNYHIEHHLLASVPYYRLPVMHRMLRDKGAVGLSPSYGDVLRKVSSVPM